MLTVHATLQPNGQVQLPPALASSQPVPVLVTILEPANGPNDSQLIAGSATGKGNVQATLDLLRSPAFLALPKSDPAEVEQRIQDLRNDWNDV
jgi:hypothetical protein